MRALCSSQSTALLGAALLLTPAHSLLIGPAIIPTRHPPLTRCAGVVCNSHASSEIVVESGAGGNGAVAFVGSRPAGGSGGDGGSVYLECSADFDSLAHLPFGGKSQAERGHDAIQRGKGRKGADAVVRVPPNCLVVARDSNVTLGRLMAPGERMLVARGGYGGEGNMEVWKRTKEQDGSGDLKEVWVSSELDSQRHARRPQPSSASATDIGPAGGGEQLWLTLSTPTAVPLADAGVPLTSRPAVVREREEFNVGVPAAVPLPPPTPPKQAESKESILAAENLAAAKAALAAAERRQAEAEAVIEMAGPFAVESTEAAAQAQPRDLEVEKALEMAEAAAAASRERAAAAAQKELEMRSKRKGLDVVGGPRHVEQLLKETLTSKLVMAEKLQEAEAKAAKEVLAARSAEALVSELQSKLDQQEVEQAELADVRVKQFASEVERFGAKVTRMEEVLQGKEEALALTRKALAESEALLKRKDEALAMTQGALKESEVKVAAALEQVEQSRRAEAEAEAESMRSLLGLNAARAETAELKAKMNTWRQKTMEVDNLVRAIKEVKEEINVEEAIKDVNTRMGGKKEDVV